MSSKNKNVRYIQCVIDVYIKHEPVKPLKDKKGKTALNVLIQIVNEYNYKPSKLWVETIMIFECIYTWWR